MVHISQIFDLATAELRPVLQAAHKLVLEIDPGAFVVASLGHRSITYAVGPKKMTHAYCYLIPHAHHVNLGFFRGTTVDVEQVLDGSGKELRHRKLQSMADLDDPTVATLVTRALTERRNALTAS